MLRSDVTAVVGMEIMFKEVGSMGSTPAAMASLGKCGPSKHGEELEVMDGSI